MPGPTFLEGDGVTLRVPSEADVDFLIEHENAPEVRATRSASLPTGPDDVRRRLGGTLGRNDDTLGLLVCADSASGSEATGGSSADSSVDERVGFVYLIREKPNDRTYRRAELAYWIAPDAQGNGYATDAARTTVAHGFDRLGLHKVVAKTFESNEVSARVLEKLGFSREGVFRGEAFVGGEWHDVVRYGLLADEWRDGDE